MIRVNIDEIFPISVSVVDEATGELVTGQTVTYDIRDTNDNVLVPAVNGTLTESTVSSGIYIGEDSIHTAGEYVMYALCTGYLTNTEDISVNQGLEDTTHLRHYNISVEDVKRVNVSPTASQTTRKVPVDNTDYIVTLIKADSASDWSDPVASGTVYAWYSDVSESVPYKMGGSS